MDYKSLLTKVERTLEQIESAESMRFTVEQIAETIAANFRDELGITGGRIYERNDDQNCYELVSRFGKVKDGALGIAVPPLVRTGASVKGFHPSAAVPLTGMRATPLRACPPAKLKAPPT